MSTQLSFPAVSAAVTSSPVVGPEPFQVLLADGATIGVLKSDVRAFKYLLHLVLINPALGLRPSGYDGWTPIMGLSTSQRRAFQERRLSLG